jgi:hypothetical protein
MSYDPTQRVPPPQNYPPAQPGYTQYPPTQSYPPTQGYTPDYAPPPVPTYQQYSAPPAPGMPGAGFDFNAFWRKLGRTGQVCLIGAVILFISFFMTWFDASGSCSGSACSENGGPNFSDVNRSASGFSIAGSGVSVTYQRFDETILGTTPTGSGVDTFSSGFVWLIFAASIALVVLPLMLAYGKLAPNQGQLFILSAAGAALLMEIIYMITAFGALSQVKGEFDDLNRLLPQAGVDATLKYSVGPSFGFWIGFLATLAIVGAYFYFGYLKKPASPYGGYLVQPPPIAYPGSQPYPPPPAYPGSQPYPPQGPYPPYPGQ